MRSLLLPTLLTASIAAQTTGVPGINDLDVNGFGAGTTSCASICYPNGGVTLNYSASVPAGAFVLVFFTLCPCSVCQLPGPSNGCFPNIPATACGGSNQSLDLNITAACGPVLSAPMSINSAGVLGLSINIPTFTGLPAPTRC